MVTYKNKTASPCIFRKVLAVFDSIAMLQLT